MGRRLGMEAHLRLSRNGWLSGVRVAPGQGGHIIRPSRGRRPGVEAHLRLAQDMAINLMTSLSDLQRRVNVRGMQGNVRDAYLVSDISRYIKLGSAPGRLDLQQKDNIPGRKGLIRGAYLVPVPSGYTWLGTAPGH